MYRMNNNTITTICLAILLAMTLFSYANYKIKVRQLMSKNIEEAITKGIDPLTVRCSYASETDNICVAFASIQQKQQEVINANKR